ncbi:unnamed protein product [Heligmosomoides polygyrus]|uniref:DDE_3 domain-containing protein n=1 Tax=Heligmosomoides polygyrus TaxID=6339 RepID=A0A183GTL3_HELPZ|nr:unnamed protein product [Heligmosomoides polygyrus]
MVTLILAMNSQCVIHTRISDDGTCTGPEFCAFVNELVSKMRGMDGMDGAWLIMTNARIYKTSELRRILEETSYELELLSPYSYMLNPAGNVFSKAKACVKRLLNNATADSMLSSLIQEGIATVTQEDCESYVLHMTMNVATAAAGQPFSV